MNNKQTVELITYEESPQYLRYGHRFKPAMSEIFVAMFLGYVLDVLVFMTGLFTGFYHVPYPVSAFSFSFISWCLYHYKEYLLITTKTIKETTETIKPEQSTLLVNTATQSRVIASVSEDKQLQGYLLIGRDYDALSAYYASCDDRGFRRDDSVAGKGAKSLCNGVTSSNFGMLRNGLYLDGYIDDKNNWTDKGMRWLNGHL